MKFSRQLTDIINQAELLKSNPTPIHIKSFSKFNNELKESLKFHCTDLRILELIELIPEISLQQSSYIRFWYWFLMHLRVVNIYHQADIESKMQKVELIKKLYQSILVLMEDDDC